MARWSLRGRVGALRGDDRGAVVIIVALFLLIFLTLVAFVVDFGRVYATNAQLQNAADAAALAAGANLDCQTIGPAAARTAAETYAANNGVPLANQVITFPTNNQVTVRANETVTTTFGQLVGVRTIAATADATVTRTCQQRYQFVAEQDFNFNGQGATVGGGIFAGQCFEGGGGVFSTVAVSTPSTFNCSPFHNGATPIKNGSKNPVCNVSTSVSTCLYNETTITTSAAFQAAGYNTAGVNNKAYIDGLFTGAPACSTINAASFSNRIVCTGNLAFPSNVNIRKDVIVSGDITTDNNTTFSSGAFSGNLVNDQVLVYSRSGQITLKMDAVPDKAVVYAPTTQGNQPSIVYNGSGQGLLGTLIGYDMVLNGGGATSGSGVPLSGLGAWRLTE